VEYLAFHWAFLHLHYAVMGSPPHFVFRKGMPKPTGVLSASLGDRAHATYRQVTRHPAIFATLFGSATGLGLGALRRSTVLETRCSVSR